MSAVTQIERVVREMERAKRDGERLTIEQAMRKVHREYINGQLWNRYGVTPSGFLVLAGLCDMDDEGRKHADAKLLAMFNRYLNTGGKLTGEKGKVLRGAMERYGIDYLNSPTYPLEPLADEKASA